jgi:Outer membrane lipoprotein-sorting protein
VTVGYEESGWQGVAWAPTKLKLAKRKCWVIEATPKDPYYAYGRRIVYIDKTAYWGYWATLYDRAGEYWKTLMWFDKMASTPGRDMTTCHPFWGMAEDVRQSRVSFFDVQSKGYYTEYQLGFPDSTYTTTNLSAMGK